MTWPEPLATVRGYVLAGGQSSRMGVDKAELRLGGRTLLEIAITKLRSVCHEVVVIGSRSNPQGAVRTVADRRAGCGPMGGIEAALEDLQSVRRSEPHSSAASRPVPVWAAFLPVDMPLLPGGLSGELVREWVRRGDDGVRVAMAVADGRPQPLVSLLHRDLLPAVEASLTRGDLKVRPMLAAAAGPRGLWQTHVEVEALHAGLGSWVPDAVEWQARSLWFGNCNTPAEFALAESFVSASLAR